MGAYCEGAMLKMSNQRNDFPLFQRIVVAVMCLLSGGTLSFLVVRDIIQGNPPGLTQGFLLLAMFLMFCAGAWFALVFRSRNAAELAEAQLLEVHQEPHMSADVMVYRFANGLKSAAVFYDAAEQMVHFYNCHWERRLFSTADVWFSCPITQLKATHVFRHEGTESLTIITAAGKATIAQTGSEYTAFSEMMMMLVPVNEPGYATDHPMMPSVSLAGALAGLFLGWFATPPTATDEVLGVFVLGGACLGVASIYGLVFLAQRWLKVGLTQPLGYGMLGLVLGLMAANGLQLFVGWSFVMLLTLCGIGALGGVAYGAYRQRQESFSSGQRVSELEEVDRY